MRIHVTLAQNSAPWDLTMELFAGYLAEYRADARSFVRTQGTGEYLSFDLVPGADGVAPGAEGVRCEGGYFPQQQLILDDGTIEGWAPIIEWFLGLLPFDAAADIFLESASVPRELPRNATGPDIARILTALDASS